MGAWAVKRPEFVRPRATGDALDSELRISAVANEQGGSIKL